jgi:hypothetical protein
VINVFPASADKLCQRERFYKHWSVVFRVKWQKRVFGELIRLFVGVALLIVEEVLLARQKPGKMPALEMAATSSGASGSRSKPDEIAN